MIAREVVIVGHSDEVRSIVALAVRRVPDSERAAWSSQLAGIANKRARMAAAPPVPSSAPQPERSTVWWIALVVGVVAAFAGATVLLPPRNEGNQDPALALGVAVPAMVVGAGVLVTLAFAAVPAAVRRNTTAIACAVIAAAATVAGGIFALLRSETLLEVGGIPSYGAWWVAAAAVLIAAGVLIARVAGSAPQSPPPHHGRPDDAARDAAVSADRAATRLAYGSDERREWRSVLARDAAFVDAAVRTQAERLGPFAYVAWAAHGGHVDARTLDDLIRNR